MSLKAGAYPYKCKLYKASLVWPPILQLSITLTWNGFQETKIDQKRRYHKASHFHRSYQDSTSEE